MNRVAVVGSLLGLLLLGSVARAEPSFELLDLEDVANGTRERTGISLGSDGALTWRVTAHGSASPARQGSGRVDADTVERIDRALKQARFHELPAVLSGTPNFGGGSFRMRVTRATGPGRVVRGPRYTPGLAAVRDALLGAVARLEAAAAAGGDAGGLVGALGGAPGGAAPISEADLKAKLEETARSSWVRWVDEHYEELIADADDADDVARYRRARDEDRAEYGGRLVTDPDELADLFDYSARVFKDAAGRPVPMDAVLVAGVDASPSLPENTGYMWAIVLDRRTGAVLHVSPAINYF